MYSKFVFNRSDPRNVRMDTVHGKPEQCTTSCFERCGRLGKCNKFRRAHGRKVRRVGKQDEPLAPIFRKTPFAERGSRAKVRRCFADPNGL
jgi:hypothetical protein